MFALRLISLVRDARLLKYDARIPLALLITCMRGRRNG